MELSPCFVHDMTQVSWGIDRNRKHPPALRSLWKDLHWWRFHSAEFSLALSKTKLTEDVAFCLAIESWMYIWEMEGRHLRRLKLWAKNLPSCGCTRCFHGSVSTHFSYSREFADKLDEEQASKGFRGPCCGFGWKLSLKMLWRQCRATTVLITSF